MRSGIIHCIPYAHTTPCRLVRQAKDGPLNGRPLAPGGTNEDRLKGGTTSPISGAIDPPPQHGRQQHAEAVRHHQIDRVFVRVMRAFCAHVWPRQTRVGHTGKQSQARWVCFLLQCRGDVAPRESRRSPTGCFRMVPWGGHGRAKLLLSRCCDPGGSAHGPRPPTASPILHSCLAPQMPQMIRPFGIRPRGGAVASSLLSRLGGMYGAMGLAGYVAEWCSDWFQPCSAVEQADPSNQTGHYAEPSAAARGGCGGPDAPYWLLFCLSLLRASRRRL